MERRAEDRIMQLVSKALATHDINELNLILGHLKTALREHCQKIRNYVIFPVPERRSGSEKSGKESNMPDRSN
jgi:hypothetical protein